MDSTGPRRGAATPPRKTYDRAATARRLRALTIATFVTSAGATAYLATLAALSTSGAATANAAIQGSTAVPSTGAFSTSNAQVATGGSSLQATQGTISAGTATGQVVTGGSHR